MKVTKLQLQALASAIRQIKAILSHHPVLHPQYQAAVEVIRSSGYPNILDESLIGDHLNRLNAHEMAALLVRIKMAAEGGSSAPEPTPVEVTPSRPSLATVLASLAPDNDSPMTELGVVTAPQIPVDEDEEEKLLREARAKRKAAEAAALSQAQALSKLTDQVLAMGEMMKKLAIHSKEVEAHADAAKQEAHQARLEADTLRKELAARPAVAPINIEITDAEIQKAVDARLAASLKETLGLNIIVPTTGGTAGAFELRSVGVPALDKGYLLDEAKEKLLNVAWAKARANVAENILLCGPTGCGKTSAIEQFCARHSLPMLMMSCQNMREVRDWFGSKTIEGGTMRWQRSQFEMAISAGNCVCVLDEYNRTTPFVNSGLLPLLDHRRAVLIEEIGEVIRVGSGVLFVGTINEGGAYTGTHGLDLAIRGRFGLRIECDYLPEKQEIDVLIKKTGIKKNQATRLVQFAQAVRLKAGSMDGAGLTGTVSTRQLITAAEYLAHGGTATLEFTVVNHFDGTGGPTSERAQVVAMLEGKFPELKGKPEATEPTPAPTEEAVPAV